jgi:hypothetical protein
MLPQNLENKPLSDDDELKRLAKMRRLQYWRERKAAAEKLGINVRELDEAVKMARTEASPKFAPESTPPRGGRQRRSVGRDLVRSGRRPAADERENPKRRPSWGGKGAYL